MALGAGALSSTASSSYSRMCSVCLQTAVAQTAVPKQAIKPAILEGTSEAFPIPPEKLIELAKKVLATDTGVSDDSVLADNFRFE